MAATTTKAKTASATVHDITPPDPSRDQRYLRIGKEAVDWEAGVCDLALVAGVSLTLLETATSSNDGASVGMPGVCMLTTEQTDQIMFIAYQVARTATEFKTKFYEAFNR